jgi:hypothetical protein
VDSAESESAFFRIPFALVSNARAICSSLACVVRKITHVSGQAAWIAELGSSLDPYRVLRIACKDPDYFKKKRFRGIDYPLSESSYRPVARPTAEIELIGDLGFWTVSACVAFGFAQQMLVRAVLEYAANRAQETELDEIRGAI